MGEKQEFFDVGHLAGDLRGRSVRGGVNMLGSQVFSLVLRTFSAIALARLVAPEAYGLVGMVSAFTAFAHLFKDLGLAQATIQKPEINHEQVNVLFNDQFYKIYRRKHDRLAGNVHLGKALATLSL